MRTLAMGGEDGGVCWIPTFVTDRNMKFIHLLPRLSSSCSVAVRGKVRKRWSAGEAMWQTCAGADPTISAEQASVWM